MEPMRFRNPTLSLLTVLYTAVAAAQTAPAPAGPVQPAALTALNNAFRAAYADAKARVLAASGTTLIVNGDTFTLFQNGRRVEANVGTPVYDPLKTIAHIPLAIYVTLTPGSGGIDDARLKTLVRLRELMPPAEASLDSVVLPAATITRQKQIVAASMTFLNGVAEKRGFERSRLLEFTKRMAPLVLQNVDEATHAQLDATHRQVSAWRRELSPGQWDELHVLIIGPHMPREDLVVTQYFLRLLHEPKEGRRVVYAESLWEEPKALDLLGTLLLDGSVGDAFFGDYMRMHRDLLGDAAKAYLTKLLP
jgi:hypothetical protein